MDSAFLPRPRHHLPPRPAPPIPPRSSRIASSLFDSWRYLIASRALIPWKAYLLMRQKTILSSVDAVRMVAAAKIEAAKNNWNVTIAVVDEGGYLLHLDRMDGAGYHTPEIATLKARS